MSNGYTTKEVALDIVLGWIYRVEEGSTGDLTEAAQLLGDGSSVFRAEILSELSGIRDYLLERGA